MSIDWKVIIDAAQFLFTIGVLVFTFFATRRKDVDTRLDQANERFTEGSRRMDRIDSRVTGLERTIEALPGKDDVHALTLTLAEVRGDLKAQNATLDAMAESLKRTENIVTRHEDHLRGEKN